MKKALVLTGGGARAAYQVGVLKAVSEIWDKPENPFPIIAGISAGAINGTFLASYVGDFREAVIKLWDLWANLQPKAIYKTSTINMSSIATSWLMSLGLGGLKSDHRINYLLDASPLIEFLNSNLHIEGLETNLASGHTQALAVSATNLLTGTAVSFYTCNKKTEPWLRSARIGKESKISLSHVAASAAIPLFFAPVQINGTYYCDGCVRLTTPLSPAIHLGAEKILAIGIRHTRSIETTLKLVEQKSSRPPVPADIAGLLLNSIFLDSLESDLERMRRINTTIRETGFKDLRHIPVASIFPSLDLGNQAAELFDTFPLPMRHMLRGLGASQKSGWDLLSYLAFDKQYTTLLLELGYSDGKSNKKLLNDFLN